MTRTEVIGGVADDLYATEAALDQAIERATVLVQSLIGARTSLNLSAVVAADAQTKALEAIASLGAARQTLVECHNEMAKEHRRQGWGVFAGPFQGKTGDDRPTTGEHRLRAV
ncbi:hypothetical protein BrevBR_13130 [Brevundimonas sp. BR2-1]|uniref:hypothetical protein n=1 Tax=unclassified Brevundimonas TaxID=2622653 RepID=UPI002FCC5CC1